MSLELEFKNKMATVDDDDTEAAEKKKTRHVKSKNTEMKKEDKK